MISEQKNSDCKLGWIVTFLVLVRDGGPSSGYASTGFFGGRYLVTLHFLVLIFLGVTLGRVLLVGVTKKVIFTSYSNIINRSND